MLLGLHRAARGQVVLGQRREGCHGHAQADRARREVDVVHVLGARGIGLRPAQGPEALEVLQALAAEQVLDGVEDGAGVRLDRHPVLRPQRLHVERRHQGGHRGAGRLVPSDLQAVPTFAQVVGVVDRPRRQPENAFLETAQQRDFLPLGAVREPSAMLPHPL
jgi:hypothetical protein